MLGNSIWKIAEYMRIPAEDLAEKIFDHNVQEQESINTEDPAKGAKETGLLAAGQTTEDKTEKKKQINMGKINALRMVGWTIGRIAEDMRIPAEEVAQAIYDQKKSP